MDDVLTFADLQYWYNWGKWLASISSLPIRVFIEKALPYRTHVFLISVCAYICWQLWSYVGRLQVLMRTFSSPPLPKKE